VDKKIHRLYEIERRAKRWQLSAAQRRALRARWSQPIVDELFAWGEENAGSVLPKGKLGEAIQYLRNRGEALRCFLYDGELEMDNNRCERTLRAIAVGRKNWLFIGSEAGGHAAAVLMSLVGSCHLNGVDPLAYLTDVITRIPQAPESELPNLLPDRWAVAQQSASSSD
jgi:transposase